MELELSKRYYTIKQLAKYTGLPSGTLYEWASNGTLPSIKLGRRVLFDVNDVNKVMKAKKRNKVDPEQRAKAILKEFGSNV